MALVDEIIERACIDVEPFVQRDLHLYSHLLSSAVIALSKVLGRSAEAMVLVPTRSYGKKLAQDLEVSGKSLKESLIKLSENSSWNMEIYTVDSEGAYILIRECPIRQICLYEGIPQGGILCKITKGVFEGFASEVLKLPVIMESRQYGPNACLTLVKPRFRSSILPPMEPFKIYEFVPEKDEYPKLVEKDIHEVLHLISSICERALGKSSHTLLGYSSKEYGKLRANLYPRCPNVQKCSPFLSQELKIECTIEDNEIVLYNLPFKNVSQNVLGILHSMLAHFVEGFLEGMSERKIVLSIQYESESELKAKLEVKG